MTSWRRLDRERLQLLMASCKHWTQMNHWGRMFMSTTRSSSLMLLIALLHTLIWLEKKTTLHLLNQTMTSPVWDSFKELISKACTILPPALSTTKVTVCFVKASSQAFLTTKSFQAWLSMEQSMKRSLLLQTLNSTSRCFKSLKLFLSK